MTIPNLRQRIARWDMREIAFMGPEGIANPFHDVTLSADFTHEDGKSLKVEGFFDGDGKGGQHGNIWKVRFMPTDTGQWTYRTHSSHAELDGHTGTLTCVPPDKPYLHGPLQVSDTYHFRHADGMRRFLVSTRLTPQWTDQREWPELLDYFKGCSVNRVFFMMVGRQSDAFLFGDSDEDEDLWRYNISRWQAIDAFIEACRKADIIASPYLYYFNAGLQLTMSSEQDDQYIRYTMARFGAFCNVMPVLSNEVEFKGVERCQRLPCPPYNLDAHKWANEKGGLLKSLAVFGQAVTVHHPMEHQATNPSFWTLLRDDPFDFSDLILKQAQVGAMGNAQEMSDDKIEYGDNFPDNPPFFAYNEKAFARHIEILIGLRQFSNPVINEEPGYELDGNRYPWDSQNPETLRRTFWTAAMAGCYAAWGSKASYIMPEGKEPKRRGSPLAVLKASEDTTGKYLRILHEFMEKQPYWEMAPANELASPLDVVVDGEKYRTTFILARHRERYILYALIGGIGTIELPEGIYHIMRLDPRTGQEYNLGVTNGGKVNFELPSFKRKVNHMQEPSDWILVYDREQS